MASFDYDVAIIGSGFGGSVAALLVLVLQGRHKLRHLKLRLVLRDLTAVLLHGQNPSLRLHHREQVSIVVCEGRTVSFSAAVGQSAI